MMGRIERKRVTEPDEVRELPALTLNLLRVGSLALGYATIQPGFRWSTHLRKETDEPLCQIHHLQLLLAGRFAVEMDDGEYVEIGPNEIFDVPPGHDAWVVGDEPAIILDFLGNIEQLGRPASKDRIVTTLLMTDIVESTVTAGSLGDAAWKQKLGEHNRLVRARLERYLGKEVNTTGDGFLAMFASAVGAIRCAASIRDATAAMGLPVRTGVHTGEVELLPGDIGGLAVHAAARVMALGGASDVMVSATTRSLVEDGDLRFESRGVQPLKGLRAPLEVFALV
ncbi:MAG TPA: adenylate/guanylate cyclase domain-containing protein [Candidatus Limnocylindrales bacterium]|nr:adenylate/guanylate cyclase domain-containing protein [Candidatus Limnocylindrales bacterium]